MPEATMKAFADHGELGPNMPVDGGKSEEVIGQFDKAGINVDTLAAKRQEEGARSFMKSWNDPIAVINSKSGALRQAA